MRNPFSNEMTERALRLDGRSAGNGSGVLVALLPGFHVLLMRAAGTGLTALAACLGRPFAIFGEVAAAVLTAGVPGP